MTRETFIDEIWRKATPSTLDITFAQVLYQRAAYLKTANSVTESRLHPDTLMLSGLGNLITSQALSLKQQEDLNTRFGADFCKRVSGWHGRGNELIAILSAGRNSVDCGKMKEYFSYLR